MDGRIWSDLPECLLERIIARLPVITICKLRCVCKKWNSLPFSPSFPELSSTSLERPYLVFPSINYNACPATLSTLCPTLSQCYDLPLNRQHPELNLHVWLPGQKSLMGADAGLLCFSSTTEFPKDHSTMLDLSALEPPTLHTLPSSVEAHLCAAPSFQLSAVADVSLLIGVVVVDGRQRR